MATLLMAAALAACSGSLAGPAPSSDAGAISSSCGTSTLVPSSGPDPCVLALTLPDGAASNDYIDVWGKGAQIHEDQTHTNGWDYTDAYHNQIRIFGPSCEGIQNGAIRTIVVTYRCLLT